MDQDPLLKKAPLEENKDKDVSAVLAGPVCPLPKGGMLYKGGAVTSAFLTVFL